MNWSSVIGVFRKGRRTYSSETLGKSVEGFPEENQVTVSGEGEHVGNG